MFNAARTFASAASPLLARRDRSTWFLWWCINGARLFTIATIHDRAAARAAPVMALDEFQSGGWAALGAAVGQCVAPLIPMTSAQRRSADEHALSGSHPRPDTVTWLGIAIFVVSGIYAFRRERVLACNPR